MPQVTLGSVTRLFRTAGADVATVARLTRDLPGYLRTTISADDARTHVLERLAAREQRLIVAAERTIYRNARSPYLRLLRHVGCELGDFRALVTRHGVEGALTHLADRGVYVTFDELKGRRETVRGSQRWAFTSEEFDNPLARPHFTVTTGGTSGRPSRVGHSLALVDEWAESLAVTLAAHGVHHPRVAFWWPLPLSPATLAARLGHPTVAWWYPVHPLPPIARLVAWHHALLGRLAGHRFPPPRRCDLETPERLVEWLASAARQGPLLLWTTASAGARVGLAASQAGRDLNGLTLYVGAEAVTDARRRHITASGAQMIARYGSRELPGPAIACANPRFADDMHVMLDRYAITRRQRPATSGGPVVDALLMTSLSTAPGKIMLNAELGDYACLDEHDCGCPLGELGLTTHLSQIRSFEKLTGEGMTFARSNVEQILEEILPARFGGTGLDYQLAEEEGADSATRLVLRVSPSVGGVDEAALREQLLAELSTSGPADRYQASAWRSAGTIEIRRESPLATRVGKVLPLHLSRQAGGQGRPLPRP